MYLSFVCQVERLNSNYSGDRSYVLKEVNFDSITSWDDEKLWVNKISQADHYINLDSYEKALDSIALNRDGVADLVKQKVFDEKRGGVKLWMPPGLPSSLYVTLLSGSDGLGDLAELADRALESQHLFLQFSVELGFSRFVENSGVPRPITFEMFLEGARMYVPNLPEVSLVRRHVP